MKKVFIIILVISFILQDKHVLSQERLDSLVNIRTQLLTNYTALSPGQKIDSASLTNISEIFITENLIINEQKKLSERIKYADSVVAANAEIQKKIASSAIKAKKIHKIMFFSGGGIILLFLIFLILFIFTKIKLNKRIKELQKVKKSYDINIKEKSDYEQSLLKDIENLTNGYKNMELKVKELEKGKINFPDSGALPAIDKKEKEELLKAINIAEKKYSEISELNKELNTKSNDLALKNIELSERIKTLENEIVNTKAGSQIISQKSDSKSNESQKTMDDIDINFYKIEKLNKLKESSAISAEEYESLKKIILSKI